MVTVNDLKKCAEATLNLSDGIEKLNLGLFGVKLIDDKIREFKTACNVGDSQIREMERLIKEGIFAIEDRNYEYAKENFRTAQHFALVEGIIRIKAGLRR